MLRCVVRGAADGRAGPAGSPGHDVEAIDEQRLVLGSAPGAAPRVGEEFGLGGQLDFEGVGGAGEDVAVAGFFDCAGCEWEN